ncbi:MAG TPA: helix-turn-helix domain-containing protein [Thermoleophilaceae bacterium]|jgi:DNA-binding HxlR family transcriptional regulator
MTGYGQFCPIAQAAEVLTQRWTPLVVRELVAGSRRFNEIQRGVPLMSSSLLTQRLRTLEQVGVVEREGSDYVLTQAGWELKPIIDQMGIWGERWVRREVSREDSDPAFLMWAIKRTAKPDELPEERTVVHFRLTQGPQKTRYWWLVLTPGDADLCLKDPGFGVDLTVRSAPTTLVSVWLGDTGLAAALRRREIELDGPAHMKRAFPKWFGLSSLAQIERPRTLTN